MAKIHFLRAGPAASVQDLGRFGVLNLGVCQTGAADSRMLKIANALVGNPEISACIEFSLLGPKVEVKGGPVSIAVVGDVEVKLNEKPVSSFASFLCLPNDVISVGPVKTHSYAYLAVSGGLDTPELYGSRSTHARAGMGGHEGRMLKDGDELGVLHQEAETPLTPRYLPEKHVKSVLIIPKEIEVLLGPQDDAFDEEDIAKFFASDYIVGRDTDRMGMRLEGTALRHLDSADILSDGIAPGSIQVPGSGLPIVLLAERQTIGGYTKIATVISCKIGVLSQALPNTKIRFTSLSPTDAIDLTRKANKAFVKLMGAVSNASYLPDTKTLMSQNLISGVVDADVCSCFVSRETFGENT